jgi:hypothetical protein
MQVYQVTVKLSSYHHTGTKGRRGIASYYSFSFLTLALDEDEWSVSRSGRFLPPGMAPNTHWIGGWVDLIAGLDTRLEEQFFTSTRDQTPVIRHYTDSSKYKKKTNGN